MAGDWIKMELGLPDKPEVIRIGRILGLPPESVVGWLLRFWGWIDVNSVDGVVDGVVAADVDMTLSLPGFAGALEAVKWLRFDAAKGCMVIPNFGRHNGESSKKRGLASKRQATWRAKSVDAHVDAGQLPEKSRVELKELKTLKPSPPPALKSLPAKPIQEQTTNATSTTTPPSNGSRFGMERLPSGWSEWCKQERPDLNPDQVFARFRDYWIAKPGKDGRKVDWPATWRNWVRDEKAGKRGNGVVGLPAAAAEYLRKSNGNHGNASPTEKEVGGERVG